MTAKDIQPFSFHFEFDIVTASTHDKLSSRIATQVFFVNKGTAKRDTNILGDTHRGNKMLRKPNI